jgi:hypothetical protein
MSPYCVGTPQTKIGLYVKIQTFPDRPVLFEEREKTGQYHKEGSMSIFLSIFSSTILPEKNNPTPSTLKILEINCQHCKTYRIGGDCGSVK